jgi:hypothetical protein
MPARRMVMQDADLEARDRPFVDEGGDVDPSGTTIGEPP